MLQLRCTKKVINYFKLGHSLKPIQPPESLLGNWYVNLIKIDRRWALIFLSERTLFSFLIHGIRKDNAKSLDALFLRGFKQVLLLEGFDDKVIVDTIGNHHSVEYTKTDNRKVLGNMNDLAQLYGHHVFYEGGLNTCDLSGIIRNINRTPQKNLGWSYAIDIVKEIVFDSAAGET